MTCSKTHQLGSSCGMLIAVRPIGMTESRFLFLWISTSPRWYIFWSIWVGWGSNQYYNLHAHIAISSWSKEGSIIMFKNKTKQNKKHWAINAYLLLWGQQQMKHCLPPSAPYKHIFHCASTECFWSLNHLMNSVEKHRKWTYYYSENTENLKGHTQQHHWDKTHIYRDLGGYKTEDHSNGKYGNKNKLKTIHDCRHRFL